MARYKVELTYFTEDGKFFSKGEGETTKRLIQQIRADWDRKIRHKGERPGFNYYHKGIFHVMLNVPEHRYNTPFLILNVKIRKEKFYEKPDFI